jgi:hypothetical protein
MPVDTPLPSPSSGNPSQATGLPGRTWNLWPLEITKKLTCHSQNALPEKSALSRAITLITAVHD